MRDGRNNPRMNWNNGTSAPVKAESESFPLCRPALRLASNRVDSGCANSLLHTPPRLYISLGDRDETSDLCSLCCVWVIRDRRSNPHSSSPLQRGAFSMVVTSPVPNHQGKRHRRSPHPGRNGHGVLPQHLALARARRGRCPSAARSDRGLRGSRARTGADAAGRRSRTNGSRVSHLNQSNHKGREQSRPLS